jgi:hypothetical protein
MKNEAGGCLVVLERGASLFITNEG